MAEGKKLYITDLWVTLLFIYYFIFLIAGVFLAILAKIPDKIYYKQIYLLHLGIIGSIGMASNGAAIFYIRKLYKLCFRENLKSEDSENTYMRRLGTIIYFIGRPLFSIGFSILVVIGLQSGFMLTNQEPLELNNGFVYMTMFISFFVGFLSGRFVKKLEASGKNLLDKVAKWAMIWVQKSSVKR